MTTDQSDPYPTGIKEAELGKFHMKCVDRLLSMLISDDGVADLDTALAKALALPYPLTCTKDDGSIDAATFIQVTETKLNLTHRTVQEEGS